MPNRQMYECRKIVMVRLLPSLGSDKGYTAGITTYRSTTAVTNSGIVVAKAILYVLGFVLEQSYRRSEQWEVELLKSQRKGETQWQGKNQSAIK